MIQNVYGVFQKKKERKNGPVIVKQGGTTIVIPQALINNKGALKKRAIKMIQESEEETA
jgi:hypothetical protein